MPVVPLLGVLFVGLKLTGYITWAWLWVLAPFWAGIALALVFLAFAFVGVGSIALLGSIGKSRKPVRKPVGQPATRTVKRR
jgi:hypothetical protein